MPTDNVEISVVIPSYNSRGGLARSVDSALKQTFQNIEIIVVDDNNPDTEARRNTESIMEAYQDNPKVRYLKHEKNKNGAAARNTGVRAARGKYIAFLDDDDEWFPEKLERQHAYIQSHEGYDCVYCLLSLDGKKEYVIPYENDAIIPLLLNRTKMYTSSLMFTKDSLFSIGGFDESFRRHQDYELLVKFFANGYKICCLREVLTSIRSLGGNRPTIEDFALLKERFLDVFSFIIDDLDTKNPGIKNKIIAANFAVVWDSAVARKKFVFANSILKKYFFVSPKGFVSQVLFIYRGRLNRKFLSRLWNL